MSKYRPLVLPLLLLWGLTISLLTIAYQSRLPVTLYAGGDDWLFDNTYLAGFLPVIDGGDMRFRYSQGDGRISFPAFGQTTPLELSVRLNAWRPEGLREVTLTLNDRLLRRVTNGEWRTYRSVITDTTRFSHNQFVVGFQSDTFVPNDYDPNNPNTQAHGVAIESLTLTPQLAPNSPWWPNVTQPAWGWIALVGCIATLAYVTCAALRAVRVGFVLALGVILLNAFIIAFARLALAAYALPVIGAVLTILLILVQVRADAISLLEKKWIVTLLVLSVICLAWTSRLITLIHLPMSGDEQIYVPVGAHYADALARGAWSEIVSSRENTEHPFFVKIAFGIAIELGELAGSIPELLSARFVSLAASVVLTALLALINPISAGGLAAHSIQIHYSAQAYLEALPALTITLAMFCFERAGRKGTRWLWLSAIFLGVTAASKYIYAIGGFALVPFLVWHYRRTPLNIVIYGGLAFICFFVANPFLWSNPLGNFLETLTFHRQVGTSELVSSYARPFYWHLLYLTRLAEWDAGMPYFSFDTLILIGGVLGLPATWRHSRLYFAWCVVALVFLLLWNTKWEQYALTLITPLCLSFGFGLTEAANKLARSLKAKIVPVRIQA